MRTVLLVIEDRALSDVLADALVDGGHTVVQADDTTVAARLLDEQLFDAAIVDVDTRARDGEHLLARLRAKHPATTAIALLPCGGLGDGAGPPPYHFAIEKPARLAAVLTAVCAAHAAIRN